MTECQAVIEANERSDLRRVNALRGGAKSFEGNTQKQVENVFKKRLKVMVVKDYQDPKLRNEMECLKKGVVPDLSGTEYAWMQNIVAGVAELRFFAPRDLIDLVQAREPQKQVSSIRTQVSRTIKSLTENQILKKEGKVYCLVSQS